MIDKIVDKVLKYDNKDNLSWTGVYYEVLKELNLDKEKDNDELLHNTIKEITRLGYDIKPIPFKLERYR